MKKKKNPKFVTIDDCVFIDYLLYFFHSRKRSNTKSLDQENLNEANKLHKTQKIDNEIKSKQEKNNEHRNESVKQTYKLTRTQAQAN